MDDKELKQRFAKVIERLYSDRCNSIESRFAGIKDTLTEGGEDFDTACEDIASQEKWDGESHGGYLPPSLMKSRYFQDGLEGCVWETAFHGLSLDITNTLENFPTQSLRMEVYSTALRMMMKIDPNLERYVRAVIKGAARVTEGKGNTLHPDALMDRLELK